jgi:4-hydroxy-tetrahydrodipicolinate synthase
MSVPLQPRGAWTALATPFGPEGVIDEARFRRLIDFQIAEGITGLVPCGTTGESPTLEWEEHLRLIDVTIEAARDRVGVLGGSGSNSTAEAVRATDAIRQSGATGALLVDCYYNGPSSRELRIEYYERILDAVPELPVVPYVIPGRTGCALGAADLAQLHLENPRRVPAVKQATGDLDRMRRDRELAGDGLALLSGDDDMTMPMMTDSLVRGAGVISVMANIIPGAISNMVAAQARGETEHAADLASRISPMLQLVGCKATTKRTLPGGRTVEVEDKFRNPVPLKTMMAGLGMIEGLGRPPLGRMTESAVQQCRQALQQVWQAAPEVLRPIEAAFDVRIEQRLEDDSVWASLTG